jgi:hypothetical protein
MTPELAEIMATWPDLPEAIRAGILAMVKAVPARRDRPDRGATTQAYPARPLTPQSPRRTQALDQKG